MNSAFGVVLSIVAICALGAVFIIVLLFSQAYLLGPSVGLSGDWEWPLAGLTLLLFIATVTFVLNLIWRKA